MTKEIFALVDCNSFYCSCERVFQPSLWKRPVIVLSNNDGCAVSRTPEAKALGIPMGAPYFKYKDIIKKNNVAVFSSNYTLYADLSSRVMKTLQKFSPEMEIYSIDEAFLSLKGFGYRDLREYAKDIRQTILRDVGIPVSIGIAETKVLAKVANRLGKKGAGVCSLLDRETHEQVLSQFAVRDLWGIGRKSEAKLLSHNIKTAKDLRDANEKFVQKLLTIQGRRIVRELKGEPCISLETAIEDKKHICTSRSFGGAVFKMEALKEAVACHVSISAEKLRKQRGLCKRVVVFIHTNPHKNIEQYSNSGVMNLMSGTSSTSKLIKSAFKILESIYRPGIEYKKCGVVLMELQKKSQSQLDFFGSYDSEKENQLMQTMDKINAVHGSWSVKAAACGTHKDWKMLSEMRSNCYTTRWSELLKAK